MVGGCYWEGTINEEYICVMESELMGGRSMVDVCDMHSNFSNWTSLN